MKEKENTTVIDKSSNEIIIKNGSDILIKVDDKGIFVNSELGNHNFIKFINELTEHKDFCAEGALTITGTSIYIDENFII